MWHTRAMRMDPSAAPVSGGGGSTGSAPAPGTSTSAGASPAGTGSPAGGGGGTFQPSAGQRLVSDADYGARDAAYSALTGAGFKDHNEFAGYAPVLKQFREMGLDPSTLSKLFGPKQAAAAASGGAGGEQAKDVPTLVREAMAAERREASQRDHGEWVRTGPKTAAEQIAKSILGEKPDEVLASFIPELVNARIFEARSKNAYPEGHDLAGMPGRINDADIQSITTDLKKIVDSLSARDLKNLGAAANREPTKGAAPAAGTQGGNGRPGEDAPRKHITREDLLEDVREELRKQSQMAGATAG